MSQRGVVVAFEITTDPHQGHQFHSGVVAESSDLLLQFPSIRCVGNHRGRHARNAEWARRVLRVQTFGVSDDLVNLFDCKRLEHRRTILVSEHSRRKSRNTTVKKVGTLTIPQAKSLKFGGSDGARTRDLRRDRPYKIQWNQ